MARFLSFNSKRIVLTIIMLVAIPFVMLHAQTTPYAYFSVSKHNVCVGEPVVFNDLSVDVNPVGRRWNFSDTVINGTFGGDQVSVYRAFYQDTNVVRFQVYHAYPDTVVSGEDTTVTEKYDTLVYVDTVYAFLHPKIHTRGDSVVCKGDTTNVRIYPLANGCVYRWHERYGSASHFDVGAVLKVVPRKPVSTYYLEITSQEGCHSWDSVTVYELQSSLKVLPESGEVCAGSPAQLIAGKADHYEWASMPYDSTVNNMTLQGSPTFYPKESTVYTMTPYGSNGCKGEMQMVTINVHQLPVPRVLVSPSFVDPQSPKVTFSDLSDNSVSSFWSFGVTDNAEGPLVEHYFTDFRYDSAEVMLRTTNDLGCYVDTSFCLAIQHFASFAPNIFTPNRTENGTFSIYTANDLEYFNIYIYNRAGRLVYHSTDPHFVWDGTHKDEDCPQGVYVYVCNYRRGGTGDVARMTGTVMLIR